MTAEHCGDLALAHLFSGLAHGAEHGRPVFEVGGEDLRGHAAGELGDEAVEHDGRVAHLVGEAAQ